MVERMENDFRADFETEVLVIGYGGAGAIAAMTDHDAGAKVTIIEKRAIGGGATRLSSGGIFVAKDMEFADYLSSIQLHRTPRDILELYAQEDMKLLDTFRELGIDITFWKGNSQEVSVSYPPLGRPSWPKVKGGANMIRVHATDPDEKPVDPEQWEKMSNNERVWAIGRTYGVHLWNQMKARTEERDIDIQYHVRAQDFIVNPAGEVIGVVAEKDGARVTYKATRGVIVCTGGFASNEQMKEAYLYAPFVYLGTNDFAHGDGQLMCQRVGARMWHMSGVCGQIAFKAPEVDQAFQVRAVDEAFVWVDKLGRRYQNETTVVLHNAWRMASLFNPLNTLEDGKEWERIPTYMIFDESMRKKAPISRDWRPDDGYQWSLDNSAEIEKGWIIKADTIEELAEKIGMEPSELALTIAKFNHACAIGEDKEFGRDVKTMKPINNGPYYAMPWVPCLISTCGGAEHDRDSRVLNNEGKPIPRLYAAGEVSTNMAWLYEAGWGHSEQVIFGKIAGANAAKETPIA